MCNWEMHYHIHLTFTFTYTALEVAEVSSNTSSCSTVKHLILGSHVSTALGIITCPVEARKPISLTVMIKKMKYTVEKTLPTCYLYDLPNF